MDIILSKSKEIDLKRSGYKTCTF